LNGFYTYIPVVPLDNDKNARAERASPLENRLSSNFSVDFSLKAIKESNVGICWEGASLRKTIRESERPLALTAAKTVV
jgi:hypothetical protein